MKIKRSILLNIGKGVAILLVIGILLLAFTNKPSSVSSTGTSTIEGDSQIIDITAKGGYLPNVINARANMKTILRVKTNDTFDCSSSLRIPSLNITQSLPSTGNTDITLGTQAPGTEINGTCSMGMYNFKIKFS